MALTKVKAGNILLTTPGASSNDVTPATTQYVTTALANLADSAPSTLNTLNELAAALGDDANFSTTVTNSIATKLPLAGGTLTGNLAITTASTADTVTLTRATTGQNNMLKFKTGSSDKWIVGQRNDSTDHFRFYSYGTSSDVLSIQTDGKVGIGTAGPLAVLEIDPPAVDTPIFAIRRQDHATIPLFKFFQDSSVSQGAGHAHMNSGNRDLSITTDANSTKTNGIYIKTTGEVGIGTTPVAHYTGYKALDIGTAMSLFSNSGSTNVATMTNNGYLNSGASQWTYKVADEATMYSQVHGDHRFSTAASGSAGGAITWLEKMRITADGKVGIGTTPVSELDIFNATSPTISLGYNGGGGNGGTIDWNLEVVSTPLTAQIAALDDGNYRMNMIFSTKTAASASSGMTERMRIASTGDIHLKCGGDEPSASVVGWEYHDTGSAYPWVKQSVGGSGNLTQYQFYNTNGAVGQIYTGGSSTTYSTSSDYRLKENVDYTWDATTLLKQLKPCKFNFIKEEDGAKPTLQGFLAHEVSNIVPGAVRYTKDAVDSEGEPEYQQMDPAKLVPLLVKTIQELEARITILEG